MMNNSDMPAMPLSKTVQIGDAKEVAILHPGLTKREDFAKTALQGLLAFYGDDQEWDMTAREAVACADALLRELEEER